MNELSIVTSNEPTLTAADIRKQVNLIQEVMNAVMEGPSKENPAGVHYGVIPGCKLPSLYKAGAEKLAMTFRLGSDYEELPGSVESDSFICYKINCKLFYIPNGNLIGNGRGTCNSKEKKFRTRMVYANKATAEEKEIGREEERTGDKGKYKVYIVPQDPWDVQNTLYKIACKRAMVAAIINATGASDIFSQDVEDLPEGTVLEEEAKPTNGKPPVNMPKEKAPETVYVDLVSLTNSKVGDKLNISAYVQSVNKKSYAQKSDKTKTVNIAEYTVADLPKDATLSTAIKVFGEPLEIMPGEAVRFNKVEVSMFKDAIQYTADEAVKNV